VLWSQHIGFEILTLFTVFSWILQGHCQAGAFA
jgi:hypothetical protein